MSLQNTNQKTTILILAAGSSSRMGRPKQLLKWGSTTLLGHCVQQAQLSKADEVYAVLGAHHQQITIQVDLGNVSFINHKNWHLGLGSSIAFGVKHILHNSNDIDCILIMLVDQPQVDYKHLNALMKSNIHGTSSIVATAYESNIGVPVLFSKKHFIKLSNLSGDLGAKHLITENRMDTTTVAPPTDLIDIDTMETYNQEYNKYFKPR